MHVPLKLTSYLRTKNIAGLPRLAWIARLGRLDQLVRYFKPEDRPCWMSAKEYAALPDSIVVRELRFEIAQRGFRTRQITLVTTLLDPQRYPTSELATLYRQRWQVELNFRHLKQTMHMDVLRCKTPLGIHKELAMFAIAYNLVRAVMLEASRRQDVPVDRISFIDAMRWLAHAPPGSPLPQLRVNPDRAQPPRTAREKAPPQKSTLS
jgi:IS4 transposase